MAGVGTDPTKIPGTGRRAHNPDPGWVSGHAGTIFLFVAGIGFVGLAIVFIVTNVLSDD